MLNRFCPWLAHLSRSITRLADHLQGALQDAAVDRCTNKLMVPTLMAYLEASMPQVLRADRKRWEHTVRLVLKKYGFEQDVRDAFRKAFAPYRPGGGSPMHLHRE